MTLFDLDAYAPANVAERIAAAGVAKARLPLAGMFMLAVCAGGFIGLGALGSVVVFSDPTLSFAASRILGGVMFSLGLILVVVAGAELFTGNNLLAMAWADRRIGTGELLRSWVVVFAGNAVGAIGLALLVWLAGHGELNGGAVGAQYVKVAASKAALPFGAAFFKGVLCNLLVCLAVWMAMAGRSVTDKVVAIVFPVSLFVAAGFEHSIANLYLIPLGLLLANGAGGGPAELNLAGLLANLLPVTLGNVAGGTLLVAAVYHVIYNRALRRTASHSARMP